MKGTGQWANPESPKVVQERMTTTKTGLTVEQQKTISDPLSTVLSERDFLVPQYEEVLKMDMEDDDTAKRAKELRMLIVKNRTQGINVWHSTTKEYFLRGGQFVDSIKRKEIAINERMEETLEGIEKFKENRRKKQEVETHEKRVADLGDLVSYLPSTVSTLGAMPQDEYTILKKALAAIKKEKDEEIEKQKKADQEAADKQKKDWEEKERERIKQQLIDQQAAADKKIADAAAKKEQQEKKKLATAPMKDQLLVWIDTFTFDMSKTPESSVSSDIIAKFKSFKTWAKNQAEKS
jgi:hypothetical protein